MKIIQLIVFLIPILLFSCKKDPPIEPETAEPVMPPLTHQGLNTFGCYINGELFVAGGGDSYWDLPPVSGSFDEVSKELGLQATKYTRLEVDMSEYVKLRAYINEGTSEYDFKFNEDFGSPGYENWGGDKCDYYFQAIPDFDLGRITITYLNEVENIIAGTFYVNLINENCEDDTLIKITDGRFDFHY